MRKYLPNPTAFGGWGAIIVTLVIFFAQGGFGKMTSFTYLYIIGLVIGISMIVYSIVRRPHQDSEIETNNVDSAIRKLWYSVLGLLGWFRNTYHWKCYGPKCSVGRPIVCSEVLENPTGVRYTAIIGVVIENRDKYPLGVNLDSARVYLEQEMEGRKVSVELENHTGTGGIMLQPTQEREFRVLTIANCIGNYEDWPTLENPRWGVRGIYVTLRGNMRELHKGIYWQIRTGII